MFIILIIFSDEYKIKTFPGKIVVIKVFVFVTLFPIMFFI